MSCSGNGSMRPDNFCLLWFLIKDIFAYFILLQFLTTHECFFLLFRLFDTKTHNNLLFVTTVLFFPFFCAICQQVQTRIHFHSKQTNMFMWLLLLIRIANNSLYLL